MDIKPKIEEQISKTHTKFNFGKLHRLNEFWKFGVKFLTVTVYRTIQS